MAESVNSLGKKMDVFGAERVVYGPDDKAVLLGVASEAQAIWNEDARLAQDDGTCVIGGGIFIYLLGPRKRNPTPSKIVRPPGLQGNLALRRTAQRALRFLEENGVACWFEEGNMD